MLLNLNYALNELNRTICIVFYRNSKISVNYLIIQL